jgi:hypothetical protein
MRHLHNKEFPIPREIVMGILYFSIEPHGVYRGCMLEKHAKRDFPINEHRFKEILYLLHSDVCGLMSIASIIRSMYHVSFIENFYHKTLIYFLKNKDEVFSRF